MGTGCPLTSAIPINIPESPEKILVNKKKDFSCLGSSVRLQREHGVCLQSRPPSANRVPACLVEEEPVQLGEAQCQGLLWAALGEASWVPLKVVGFTGPVRSPG